MMIHLNGSLMAASQARIDPTDRGLTLGDGLYETLRARDGQALRLPAHLARLRRGAEVLSIPLELSDDALAAAMAETLKANSIGDGVLRLTLTRGPASRGLAPPVDARPTLLISAGVEEEAASTPLNAVIATVTRRNEHSPLSGCKTTNCLDNILARQEARRRGADEAILLNTAGRLAETTIANLFVVIGGSLITPPLSEGALPGVMRAQVIKTAAVEERPLEIADLADASEAFVTNSLGLRPLASVDGITFKPGAMWENLLKMGLK